MNDLEDVELADNPEPRCPCILLLDISASMRGNPIDALNQGLHTFQKDLHQDDLARRRVEIAIITFGSGGVGVAQDFVTAQDFEAPTLTSGGSTPMGAAIHLALDMLNDRKVRYVKNSISYYRPWVFMITDGAPTDQWDDAALRLRSEETAKALTFFAVGIAGADMEKLAKIGTRKPLMLQGLKFSELFLWLSRSQQRVSASKPGEAISLPPVGWAEVEV